MPLSFAQHQLWFLQRLDPDGCEYLIPAAVRLKGQLDEEALEGAFNEVIRRHEVLRTTFSEINGNPFQVIAHAGQPSLVEIDLSLLPHPEREEELYRLASVETQIPFDLSKGPLIRAKLIKIDQADHALLVTMHHIVSDGWSIGILIKETATLYEAYARRGQSPLEELNIQYADYAAWQIRWLSGGELERQLAYWRRQLAGIPEVLELDGGKRRSAARTNRGASESVVISKRVREELKAIGRHEGATLFMTLLAAFKVLLFRYANRTDIVVGTDIAGRNRVETENLIGFFINQLVLRTDLSGDPTFIELIGRVRHVAEEAYAHQDLPFNRLVEELNPNRSMSRTPLFQVKLVLQNTPMPALSVSGLDIEPFNVDKQTVKYDLLLELVEMEQGLVAALDYSTDIFEAGHASRMLRRFQDLLRTVVERPDARLRELVEMLDEADSGEWADKQNELKQIRRRKLKGVVAKSLFGSKSKEGVGHEPAGNQ
jgi:hypothetical protein